MVGQSRCPKVVALGTERKTGAAFGSPFSFRRYGQSGLPVSEIFPHVAKHVDDLCVIRSMRADVPNHEPSLMLMNCGDGRLVRPSMGSWVTYGLGSENQNLPGFVVLCPGGYPITETQNWRSAFLPGIYQGTYVDPAKGGSSDVIPNLKPARSDSRQASQLDLLRSLNRRHAEERGGDSRFEARIQSFELAYRMQVEASDAFDVSTRIFPCARFLWFRGSWQTMLDCSKVGGTRREVCSALAWSRPTLGQS